MINWIAEIGSNHNQDVDRLARLIVSAKQAGFGYVKLQKFNGKKLIHGQDKSDIELSDDMFLKAVEIARSVGIKIGCSVFDIESLEFVAPHVDFLKISSFDVDRGDLHHAIKNLITAKKLKKTKLILSFGMSPRSDIASIIDDYDYNSTCIIAMHCISKYPTQLNECRMNKLVTFSTDYPKGWSDHTVSEIAILTAISKGATWIEAHIDLDDMAGAESHHGHVWPISKIGKLISDYNDCCRYDDEFQGDRMNMADPEDGMRPPKELR